MSHVADVDLRITDLDALRRAADELGLEFVEGATTYNWYGAFLNDWRGAEGQARAAVFKGFDPSTFGQCEHKLRIKGAGPGTYEIGLVKSPQGGPGWVPIYDAYGHGGRAVENVTGGVGMPALKQGYAREVTVAQLKKQGYIPQVIKQPDGQLKVIGRKL